MTLLIKICTEDIIAVSQLNDPIHINMRILIFSEDKETDTDLATEWNDVNDDTIPLKLSTGTICSPPGCGKY